MKRAAFALALLLAVLALAGSAQATPAATQVVLPAVGGKERRAAD